MKEFKISICEKCYELEGDMCHEPECVFCRRTVAEVSEYLDVLCIRPIVDGVQVDIKTDEETKDDFKLEEDKKELVEVAMFGFGDVKDRFTNTDEGTLTCVGGNQHLVNALMSVYDKIFISPGDDNSTWELLKVSVELALIEEIGLEDFEHWRDVIEVR